MARSIPQTARLATCILFLYFISISSYAGGPTGADREIKKIPIFKSRVFQIGHAVHRVSVGNPKIGDIKLLPNNELYVLGKKLGSTNIMIWDKNEQLADVIDIEITHDLNGLKARLHEFLPSEKLGVQTSQGQLLISGQASNLHKMNTAVELAKAYAAAASVSKVKSTVLNMMTVGGIIRLC
ncbi:pilus assembly protein N-terminal domain-containing protein [Shewanella psychropiezotolerans]|uniref:pilus assembly protein N-terminal domain-containing protein n=1 Tax=Shewanella psychropiezotolerans TaxID=2593655 RepID=UPI001E3CF1C2|nr:pilus assembly protein N-terminal domain-containing protein [Shewanella psychropiezotolerans]